MRLLTVLLLTAFAGAAAACSSGGGTPTPVAVVLTSPVANPTATPEAMVTTVEGEITAFEVNLSKNGSPQQGTAVFSRKGELTHVEIKVRPGVPAQSVTLRRGLCPAPVGFVEELDTAIGGVMRQEIRSLGWDELLMGGLAIVLSTGKNNQSIFSVCTEMPKLE